MAGEDINDYATSTALSQEVQRATDRETALNTNIQNEITRATGIEQGLQSSKADASSVYTKTEVDNKIQEQFKDVKQADVQRYKYVQEIKEKRKKYLDKVKKNKGDKVQHKDKAIKNVDRS